MLAQIGIKLRDALGSAFQCVTKRNRVERNTISTIGVYALCYQEASWLKANIEYMYPYVDAFHIVIGSSDHSDSFSQPPDTESELILNSIFDPDQKIKIIASGQWRNKDDMTAIATKDLNVDAILQLDADEFWPLETLEAARAELQKGADIVSAPHYIFWGDLEHQCALMDGETLKVTYVAPGRLFRVFPNATLKHFQWAFVDNRTNKILGKPTKELGSPHGIWHFGWMEEQRLQRKFDFYRKARNAVMPTMEEFHRWERDKSHNIFTLGPNKIKVIPYEGPTISSDVAAAVNKIIQGS